MQGNPGLSEANAIVMDNDVTMSATDGTVFGDNSAGIMILGFAQGNAVLNNVIRGRARAALAVTVKGGGIPGNSTFVSNDLQGFQSSLADVFVDAGVTSTVAVAPQSTVEDHGAGTVIAGKVKQAVGRRRSAWTRWLWPGSVPATGFPVRCG